VPEFLLERVCGCKGRRSVEQLFIKPFGLQKPVRVSDVSISGTVIFAVLPIIVLPIIIRIPSPRPDALSTFSRERRFLKNWESSIQGRSKAPPFFRILSIICLSIGFFTKTDHRLPIFQEIIHNIDIILEDFSGIVVQPDSLLPRHPVPSSTLAVWDKSARPL